MLSGRKGGTTSPSSVRYHRILRRGREYGVCLSPAKAIAPAAQDEPESGIHFICLNANILRQFEFLQNAWIASTKFSGMTGESDPLLGDRLAIPGAGYSDFICCKRATSAPCWDFLNLSQCRAARFLPVSRALRIGISPRACQSGAGPHQHSPRNSGWLAFAVREPNFFLRSTVYVPHLYFGIAATSQFFREIRADLSRLENAMIKTRLQRVSAGLTYLVSYFASIPELRRGRPSGVLSIVIGCGFAPLSAEWQGRFFEWSAWEYDHAASWVSPPNHRWRPGGLFHSRMESNELEFHARCDAPYSSAMAPPGRICGWRFSSQLGQT
jgi:hypothetical protein